MLWRAMGDGDLGRVDDILSHEDVDDHAVMLLFSRAAIDRVGSWRRPHVDRRVLKKTRHQSIGERSTRLPCEA
ncbi:hypothetical protein Poli38472_014602 [Pythium oligandrum]|uniref:Uncharacterized protein n=1 Tax=Pythium oligandrum TaxID=41045 RepID=A0A8K1CQ18_PYTOL|nr:hypothetical protein Poli38472_014602 [Pythium oligandrum]|eukprot:TMW66626.1 hypothetical protein Poli38472_014602 [Pythium oligandrum]